MAVVELDGAHEWALPEVGSGESVVRFGSIVWSTEYAVVLEAAGSAADLGGVEEVAVALGDGDGGGVVVPTQEQKRVVAIGRHQWVRHFLASQFGFSQNPHKLLHLPTHCPLQQFPIYYLLNFFSLFPHYNNE